MITFNDKQSIYLQIAGWVCEQVLTGKYKSGDKISSVRELGAELEVNPNTVMRSYDYLQQLDIIVNRRGIGFFVSDDAEQKIRKIQLEHFIRNELPPFFKTMNLLGISLKDVESYYQQWRKESSLLS